MKVLGIAGSLRKGSYNKLALRAAVELKPADMEIEEFDLAPIPLYSEDVKTQGFPAAVQHLGEAIRAADALLICTPEYNYSMPGVLKNAIDWVSRLPQQPFNDKPAAIMGASTGRLGTARAQYHLRQTAVFVNLHVLNQPEVMIAGAATAFDAAGRLNDDGARKLIAELLVNLAAWSTRLRGK